MNENFIQELRSKAIAAGFEPLTNVVLSDAFSDAFGVPRVSPKHLSLIQSPKPNDAVLKELIAVEERRGISNSPLVKTTALYVASLMGEESAQKLLERHIDVSEEGEGEGGGKVEGCAWNDFLAVFHPPFSFLFSQCTCFQSAAQEQDEGREIHMNT